MSYETIYEIAREGMSLEKLRVDTVANNIANQHTVFRSDGTGFQPMEVSASAKPFADYLQGDETFGIDSVEMLPQKLPANKVYQPGHPLADKRGYISYPGISTVNEMTTLLRASRAYEANIKIINTAHSLYLQTLTIGEER